MTGACLLGATDYAFDGGLCVCLTVWTQFRCAAALAAVVTAAAAKSTHVVYDSVDRVLLCLSHLFALVRLRDSTDEKCAVL